MGKGVTIREVAAECGLSVSAVSQVLNGKEIGIPQKTKEKVRAAAEKLRYRPNSAARSLVTSRSDTVGVLVPDISNAFFGEAFKEIQRRMGEEGFDVLLCSGDGTAKQDERFLRLFAARGADGLIVAPAAGDTFCGALAARLSAGEDERAAVSYALAAASLAVTKQGAQRSIPFEREVREFLENHS